MVAINKTLLGSLIALASISGVAAQCDVQSCVQAMVSDGLSDVDDCAAAAAELGANPIADISCVISLAQTAIDGVENCKGCTVAAKCDPNDGTAKKNGCSQLGPNHCLQLKSSVPQPSKTDKTIDRYTFHCHNNGLVAAGDGGTCTWPCTQCDQCAGVPSNKRQLEAVMFEA